MPVSASRIDWSRSWSRSLALAMARLICSAQTMPSRRCSRLLSFDRSPARRRNCQMQQADGLAVRQDRDAAIVAGSGSATWVHGKSISFSPNVYVRPRRSPQQSSGCIAVVVWPPFQPWRCPARHANWHRCRDYRRTPGSSLDRNCADHLVELIQGLARLQPLVELRKQIGLTVELWRSTEVAWKTSTACAISPISSPRSAPSTAHRDHPSPAATWISSCPAAASAVHP